MISDNTRSSVLCPKLWKGWFLKIKAGTERGETAKAKEPEKTEVILDEGMWKFEGYEPMKRL